jgi:hypothetical protein
VPSKKHPVQDHADAFRVEMVHEGHEVLRRAVAAGGREIARGLVSPGSVERVLRDGHQFHMGETEFLDVGGEPGRQFAVGEKPPFVLGNARPGAQMHLVDAHRPLQGVLRTAHAHPFRIAPVVGGEVRDPGSGAGADLGLEGEGVGLFHPIAVDLGNEMVFVGLVHPGAGDEALPDAAVQTLHQVGVGVPSVEFADDGDPACVGCPDREGHSLHALLRAQVRPQLFPDPLVAALAVEMKVQ